MKKLLIVLLLIPLMCTAQFKELNFGGKILTFQGQSLVTPTYNTFASAYFNREYEVYEPDKELISEIFDRLEEAGIYPKLYVFYSFATYSDSANMHSWTSNNNVVTFESASQKPNFFRYSGIESVTTGVNANGLYANTNFNPVTAGVDGDSLTIGIWLDDKGYYTDSRTNFGAYDGTNRTHAQIGRSNNIGFSFLNSTTFISSATTTNLTGLFNFSRKIDSVIIHEGNNRIYNDVRTFTNNVNSNYYLCARNENGNETGDTDNTISFFYVSELLTDAEITEMNNILTYFINQRTAEAIVYEDEYIQYKYHRANNINNMPIIWQKGNQMLCAINDTVYLSLDGGATFPYKRQYTGTDLISSAFMFSNNNIVICNEDNDIVNSLDSLTSFNTLTLYYQDSTAYTIHTPVSATYPGDYFDILQDVVVDTQGGQEIALWGGYVNNSSGAAPVNVYYSADSGKSVRVAYEFGQNPNHRDDGTGDGGTTGTLLGDAGNPIIAVHVHKTARIPTGWIFCTGDETAECRWFFGTYNSGTDKWSFDTITGASCATAGRYKSTGLQVEGDTVYFGSDDNLGTDDYGFFKCHYNDIGNTGNHIELGSTTVPIWNVVKDGDNIIQSLGFNGIKVSNDNGATWSPRITLDEIAYSYLRILGQRPNSGGWISYSDINAPLINRKFGGSILIKVK